MCRQPGALLHAGNYCAFPHRLLKLLRNGSGVGIEMNEAAKRMVAAETIQRRWRAKKARAAVESGTTLPDGNVEASTAGRPVGLGAASSSDRPRDEQMPPGLTKMQQMAWKRTREKEQQAQ